MSDPETQGSKASKSASYPRSWTNDTHNLLTAAVNSFGENGSRDLCSLNIGKARHTALTLFLWNLFYRDTGVSSGRMSLVYQDNSHGKEFFVGPGSVRPVKAFPMSWNSLRLGLMSNRHPELDYFVDLYVSTNVELSGAGLSMAEEEQVSYANTTELLMQLPNSHNTALEVFHSGLEPMVVGFYLAVVDFLEIQGNRGADANLWILPKFFHLQQEVSQSVDAPLSKHSPGASPANYLDGPYFS